MSMQPWWKGGRGEWFVVIQIAGFLLVALGPRTLPDLPAWTPALSRWSAVAGAALSFVGLALIAAGIAKQGRNLTALPHPKDDGRLIETGAYAIIRHPMYGGAILAAFGWGLWVHGVLTLCYAGLLFVFFDIKSRLEERWLGEKFAEYARYRHRVRKLIPLLY